jgi:hypothetical protein
MTHVIHVLVLKRYIITRSMRKDNMSFFHFMHRETLSDLKDFTIATKKKSHTGKHLETVWLLSD